MNQTGGSHWYSMQLCTLLASSFALPAVHASRAVVRLDIAASERTHDHSPLQYLSPRKLQVPAPELAPLLGIMEAKVFPS